MRSVFTKEDLEKLNAKKKAEYALRDETAPEPVTLPTDNRLSQMSKFIPAEVVAFFVGAFGLVELAKEGDPVGLLSWAIFAGCFVATIAYTYGSAKKEKIDVQGKVAKTILTTIAFIIWALNIEGFTANLSDYNSLYGSLALLAFTTFAPDIYKLISR